MSAIRLSLAAESSVPQPTTPSPDIAIVEGLSTAEVFKLLREKDARHVVQKDSLEFEAELRAAEVMCQSPHFFLDNPIATIFGQEWRDLAHFSMTLNASEKKHQLLTKLNEYIADLPKPRSILLQALTIADELYTNGAKNSWDPHQKPFHEAPIRQGTIEFFAAASETRLILGCRDSFGFLQVDRLLRRLYACSEQGIAQAIQPNTWGAGIGAYTTFESCASFYVGVEPEIQTVVCASLPMGVGHRAADQLRKNIHIVNGT